MPEAERKLFSTGIHLGIKTFGDIMLRLFANFLLESRKASLEFVY